MVVLSVDDRAAASCGRWGRSRASRPGALGAPGRGRRGSGCRPEWRASASLQGQECLRYGDERDVVVPAAVGAAFEVIQAERVLELAVVVLDPPAHLPQPHEVLQLGIGGEVGEPVLGWLISLGGPLAQQPADREVLVSLARGVAQFNVGGPDSESKEPGVHLSARALAPSDRLGGFLAGGQREFLERAGRLVVAGDGRAAAPLVVRPLALHVLGVGGGAACTV